MKLLVNILFLLSSVYAFADCTELYSSVTYAFSHSGRSLKADNFDHQRYYAKRSMQALEKAEGLSGDCGCGNISDLMYDIKENLERAMDPEDWDTGRFYVKKAREFLSETITALDICTADTDPVPASPPENEKESDYAEDNRETTSAKSAAITLAEKQKALKKEQEALIAKQKELEMKIEEQRRVEKELEEARQEEFEAQKALKVRAEIELYKLESAAVELINSFTCSKKYEPVNDYKRGEEVLQEESFEETRGFYMEKLREVIEKVTQELRECSK